MILDNTLPFSLDSEIQKLKQQARIFPLTLKNSHLDVIDHSSNNNYLEKEEEEEKEEGGGEKEQAEVFTGRLVDEISRAGWRDNCRRKTFSRRLGSDSEVRGRGIPGRFAGRSSKPFSIQHTRSHNSYQRNSFERLNG